ncbi:MAG: hypothetical protein LBT60_01770 [Oscillospiraceae bacterium]|nr:hypothetical protein [Oscillospiraceae bacterium]
MTSALRESLLCALDDTGERFDRLTLDLVGLIGKTPTNAVFFEEKFRALAEEKAALKALLDAHAQKQTATQNNNARLDELTALLDSAAFDLTQYDDALARRVLECVRVVNGDMIAVRFKGGVAWTQRMNLANR